MPNLLVTAFNAGELSPFMDSRADVEKYASGCRTLENMMLTPYGAAFRRPGLRWNGFTKYSSKKCRLTGFNFSTSTRFVLEFGDRYMRVWDSTGSIIPDPSKPNTPLEIVTPYAEAILFELQHVQINDVMFIAHADYAPRKISRIADNDWKIEEVTWVYPPLVDLTTEQQAMVLASTALNATNNTLFYTNASQRFTDSDVGTEFELKFRKDSINLFIEQPITGNVWSSVIVPVNAGEEWDFQTTGTWNATVGIYRTVPEETAKGLIQMAATRTGNEITVTHPNHGYTSGDFIQTEGTAGYAYNSVAITVLNSSSYKYASTTGASTGTVRIVNLSKMELVRQYDSNGDRNITSSGKADELGYYKIKVSNYTSNTNGRCVFESRGVFETGIVRVDSLASSTTANVTVVKPCGLATGARTSISAKQSAFNAKNGYPRTVAVHEQRLCFGGTRSNPQTVWCSCTDDFVNFEMGSNESNALQFTIAASEGNRMQWMYSQRKLMIGTAGDEWTVGAADSSSPLTANNVQALRQSNYGSKYMRAAVINDVLLFVQRKGRKLRELVYNLDRDGWVAPDLTVLSEHITDPQVVELAFVGQPDAVVYAVRSDGVVAAMTYERDQQVIGWSRIVTDGQIESVATIYGTDNNDDEVWFVVNRNGTRMVERFHLFAKSVFESESVGSYRYLDSYRAPTNSFAIESVSIVGGQLQIVLSSSAFTLEPAAGDIVTFSGVGGATGLNGTFKLKASADGFGWILTNPTTGAEIDATGWAAYTSGGTATWDGIYSVPQFSGTKSVLVYKNDGTYETATATNGRLPYSSQPAAVGLPYTSTLIPMKPAMQMQDGTSRGRNTRIHQISASLYKTIGGQYSTDGTNWYPLTNTTESATAVYSGERKVCSSSDFTVSPDIRMRQTEPYPFCVRSLVMNLDAYGQ